MVDNKNRQPKYGNFMTDDLIPHGQLVIQIVAMPADTNANGDIFGGWLVSKLDMGAGIAARHRARSRVVTVAITDLVFIKPVSVGDTVCCYADLLKVGRSSMQFRMQAWTLSPTEKLSKAAEGIFTFVAIDEDRKPHAVDR